MPTQKSAWKDLRKNIARNERNIGIKSALKTFERKVETLISAGKKAEAKNFYKILASKLDRAAAKNIMHKNTASRKKSRLMKKLNKLA